ncbi:MAG: hypothetical protein ABEI53_00750 [Candidatus Magasanikbacteria bacterium]
MIEVEIRGKLNKKSFEELKNYFQKEGEHIESHNREMILLRGYPGYSENPNEREVDIRLRNTDGDCEIMVKRSSSNDNQTRKETSLPLEGNNLENAKEIAKAFGADSGLWMSRKKDIFMYEGIEFSLVQAPKDYYFYEAEYEVENEREAREAEKKLKQKAEELDLKVMTPEQTKEFFYELDEEVNKDINL